MNAMSGRWRRVAQKIVGHASWVLPGGQSSWGDAMWRELDYIEDDRVALRWAIGCVTASYVRARGAAAARPAALTEVCPGRHPAALHWAGRTRICKR
jgi:hypothetical protein